MHMRNLLLGVLLHQLLRVPIQRRSHSPACRVFAMPMVG